MDPGDEAVELGIALRVVPDERLTAAADAARGPFAGKSRACLTALKRQLAAVEGLSAEEALGPEIEEFLAYVTPADSDAQEGYRAWRENRAPAWS